MPQLCKLASVSYFNGAKKYYEYTCGKCKNPIYVIKCSDMNTNKKMQVR